MEYLSNTCECVEEELYQTICVRDSQTRNLTKGLGPHDLFHLIKTQPHQKKKKNQVAQIGFYHFAKGLNVSSLSSVASYFGRILRSQVSCDRKRNRWNIISGSFRCYNAFSRVDLVVTYSQNGKFQTKFLKRNRRRNNRLRKNKKTLQDNSENTYNDQNVMKETEQETKNFNNKKKKKKKKKKQKRKQKKKNFKENETTMEQDLNLSSHQEKNFEQEQEQEKENENEKEEESEEIEESEILWAETQVSSWLRSVLFPKDFRKLKSLKRIQDFDLTNEKHLLSSITKIFKKSKYLGCSSVRGVSTLSDNYLIDGLLKYFFSSYRYTCGIKFFRVLAKKEPGLLRCVAKGYRKLGKLEKALQVIRMGLIKKPSLIKMKIELIKILVALRKFKRALYEIDELQTLAPFIPESWLIDAKTSLIDKNFHRMFLALSKIPWSNTLIPNKCQNEFQNENENENKNKNENENENGNHNNNNNNNNNNNSNGNGNDNNSSLDDNQNHQNNNQNEKNSNTEEQKIQNEKNNRIMYLNRSKIDHYFVYPDPIRITRPPKLAFNKNIYNLQLNNNKSNKNKKKHKVKNKNKNALINDFNAIYLDLFLKNQNNNIILKGIAIQIYTLLCKFIKKVGWERFVELHKEVFRENIRDAARKKRSYYDRFGVMITNEEHRNFEKCLLNEPSYDESEIIENEKKNKQLSHNRQEEESDDLQSSSEINYSLNTSDSGGSISTDAKYDNGSYSGNSRGGANHKVNRKEKNTKLFQGYLADLESEDNNSDQFERDENPSRNVSRIGNKNLSSQISRGSVCNNETNNKNKNKEIINKRLKKKNISNNKKQKIKKIKSTKRSGENGLLKKKALEPMMIPHWMCYHEPHWLSDISEQIHYDLKTFHVIKFGDDNAKKNSSNETRTEKEWLDVGVLALKLGEIQKAHDAFLLAITDGDLKSPIIINFSNRTIIIELIELLSKNGQFIKALELSNLLLHFQDQKQSEEQLLSQKSLSKFFAVLKQLIFKIVFQKGMSFMDDFIENFAYTKRLINTRNDLKKSNRKKRSKSTRRKKKRLSPKKKIHEEIILFVQLANQLKVDGYQK
ncbi:bud site selection protein [Anaeramoeba flamelloides]|uniref:Bud site selection protein n=1 Tax=Anaeramoeba flamelloides TaxID=1746091 RepID=A0ABQ8XAH5_9EUKA|nr:bud site selection protein [Anaeramoeba flamelloides]